MSKGKRMYYISATEYIYLPLKITFKIYPYCTMNKVKNQLKYSIFYS